MGLGVGSIRNLSVCVSGLGVLLWSLEVRVRGVRGPRVCVWVWVCVRRLHLKVSRVRDLCYV